MAAPIFHRDGTVSFDNTYIVGRVCEALNGNVWFECWAPNADAMAFESPGMTRKELRRWVAEREDVIRATARN